MSDPNNTDPKEPAADCQDDSRDAERPEADAQSEPPTKQLPAAGQGEADATTVLPAVEQEPSDATAELPSPAPADATAELPPAEQGVPDETAELPAAGQGEADATTVLPAVEQEPSDATAELPSPAPADATAELPPAEQGVPDETAELPAAGQGEADATTVLPAVAAAAAHKGGPGHEAPVGAAEPQKIEPDPSKRSRAFGFKTAVLGLVVLLLLGVVGVLGGELVARRLLTVCADEAAENVLHTKAAVGYDRNKFLLASLLDHEIPSLSVEAKNAAVDKFDQNGNIELKESIRGLDISARLEDIHVVKDGGSVGHMATRVVWTADGIRQTLANPDLKGPNQTESPITSVNTVKLDPEHNQFSVDVNGKIGPLQARAVVIVQPQIDRQHNLQIKVKNVDLPDFHSLVGIDVSNIANSIARPAIEQVAGRVAGYPMGLKAKSVQVRPDSIEFQFYADDAPLVKGTKCTALRWFE